MYDWEALEHICNSFHEYERNFIMIAMLRELHFGFADTFHSRLHDVIRKGNL